MREEFSAGVINSLKRGVNLVLHSSNSPRSSQSLGLLSTLPGRIRSETMDLMADKEQLDWMRRGVAALEGRGEERPGNHSPRPAPEFSVRSPWTSGRIRNNSIGCGGELRLGTAAEGQPGNHSRSRGS